MELYLVHYLSEESIVVKVTHSFVELLKLKSDWATGRWCLQASLSRAFGRKLKQERLNGSPPATLPSSRTEDHDAFISTDAEASSVYSEARNWTLKKSQADKHRRVKSSSDIESITITRVWFLSIPSSSSFFLFSFFFSRHLLLC